MSRFVIFMGVVWVVAVAGALSLPQRPVLRPSARCCPWGTGVPEYRFVYGSGADAGASKRPRQEKEAAELAAAKLVIKVGSGGL